MSTSALHPPASHSETEAEVAFEQGQDSDHSSGCTEGPPTKKQRILSALPTHLAYALAVSGDAPGSPESLEPLHNAVPSRGTVPTLRKGAGPMPTPALPSLSSKVGTPRSSASSISGPKLAPVSRTAAVPAPAAARPAVPVRGPQHSLAPAAQASAHMPTPAEAAAAEADKLYSAEMLLDLAGSTSAEVRRMNDDERALVHFKRRLRNRESAKRSRARRQATINDIQTELHDLRELTSSLVERCVRLARETDRQSADIETLRKEKSLLESMLRTGGADPLYAPPARSSAYAGHRQ